MDFKDVLKAFAPTVASAVAGPLGGVVVAGLGKLFGIDEPTIQSVGKAISDGKMTPEQMVEIRKMEADLLRQERELGFKYADLEFQNTDSARKMQMTTQSRIPGALAMLITFGFFGILIAMMYGVLKVEDQQSLLILLGALASSWGAIVNFYFGSSHGSRAKDELLARSDK